MRSFRRFLSILTILFITSSMVFAASEDQSSEDEGEWFWNQTITAIDFEGLKNVRKSEVAGIIGSFIGTPFTENVYSDIIDRLYALDVFEDIVPFAKHASSKNKDVLLVFQVKEQPVITDIKFVGNKQIRNGELREQIKIKSSDVYVESKVLTNERIIRDFYLSKGYTNSKVTHKTEETEKGFVLTFNIVEGHSTVISEIHFTGNSIVSEKTLRRKIGLKEVGFLKDGAFQGSTLEQDKRTITNYYLDRGYIDAAVVDVKIEENFNSEKNRNELALNFIIQEGSQYTFGGITVSGNEVFSTDDLVSCIKLKEGAVFNTTKFQEGLTELTGKYYENGYMSNEFAPIPAKDSERQVISYHINIVENVRSHIENVIIKGNNKTKDYVIRREIPIEAGDIFSREKIVSGMRNLYNLQYFSEVIPEPQAGSEDNLVDLVWTVEEGSTTNLQFGMTFSGVVDPDGIPISLFGKVETTNLFGEGKSVSAGVNYSTTEQSVELSYSQNWIGNLPVAYSQSVSLAHKKSSGLLNMWEPDLTLRQRNYYMDFEGWTATLGTAFYRRWAFDYAILTGAAGLSNAVNRNIYDESMNAPIDLSLALYANRWGLENAIWTSFSVDNRDINFDPSKGWFASERVSWNGLLPNVEQEFFLRSDTKFETYFTLLNKPFSEKWNLKVVLAAYSGLSTLFPLPNTSISDANRLYIDGIFNGRGWSKSYRDSGKGQAMWSNKLELRMPIVPNILGLGLFWDAVAVKPTVDSMFTDLSVNDMYFSFGPNVRFLIQQFPINLVFAYKYKYEDGKFAWDGGGKGFGGMLDSFEFTLSFNLVNR